VGSAINLSKRINSYYQDNELNRNPRPIKDALLRYGHNNFSLEILEYCNKEELINREQYYLDILKPEYNVLKQAYSLLGFKHKPETIEKLKLKTLTRDQKEFLSAINKGKEVSDETKLKLSESLKKF
jgi:group I intron endonuclease